MSATTYALIPRMTAVSTWLADEIEKRHGLRPVPVPISAGPDLFYPRGNRAPPPPVRIVAMLRFEERRGMSFLLPALAKIAHRPDVEIVFFGHQQVARSAATFRFRHAGVLSTDRVAALLSSAHVVVDPSLFQGFGLVGLEGMSSGAACVVTASGGVSEYAVDGENALVVPPATATPSRRRFSASSRTPLCAGASPRRAWRRPPFHVGAGGGALPGVSRSPSATPCRRRRGNGRARPSRRELRAERRLGILRSELGRAPDPRRDLRVARLSVGGAVAPDEEALQIRSVTSARARPEASATARACHGISSRSGRRLSGGANVRSSEESGAHAKTAKERSGESATPRAGPSHARRAATGRRARRRTASSRAPRAPPRPGRRSAS